MSKPIIVVTGILDTKGEEIKFLADCVKLAGGDPIILEISVGKEVGWADIGVSEVLKKVDKTVEEIFALNRGKASDFITKGAIKVVREILEDNKIDGIIAYGGSMGSSIATSIMRSLPIGLPKLMLTTMASGDITSYIGTRDICIMYPIAEAGLNKITRKILNNAAAGIVGMAKAPSIADIEEKPLIGCMMFGVTTPCVLRSSEYMKKKGYDVIINHAVGSGGRSMEELIREGLISGILDITTHEIGDFLLGGILSAGPDRLTAAGDKGIPQVIAPGGLDLINFGPKDTVPERFLKQTHLPGKGLYVHNPNVTCIGVSPDEAYRIAGHIAEKVNRAKGSTAICVPMRGWGACDLAVPNKDLGWAGPGPGPVWVADPERPEWSQRSRSFVKGLQENIDRDKSNLDVLVVDKHLNEPEFADLMAELLEEMLAGKWKKGSHQDLPYIIPFDEI